MNKEVTHNKRIPPSDFLERYDYVYGPKMGARASSFRAVLREASYQGVSAIVETGSVRQADNWAGDGQSSIIWGDYAKCVGGTFTTIDLDTEATEMARKLVPFASCVCGDSVSEILKKPDPIDLLYLDSYDVDMSSLTSMHAAALHGMFELTAAIPRLHPKSIVFVDDSPIAQDGTILGKGLYVAQYFKQLGILPFVTGYQSAWLMP